MHLTYRPARPDDVGACLALLPPEFACAPALRACLPALWRSWLGAGAMLLTVIEEGVSAPRPVGFGASAFVTDAFADEAQTRLPPPLAAQVAQKSLDGCSPLLSREAVGRANAGAGLNLLVLMIGWAADRSHEEVRWVKAKLMEAFVFTHGGYKLRQVLQEVYSREEMERGLAIGARLLTDYASCEGAALPPPDSPARPYLIGARRGEVRDGSALSPLFFYAPPRFGFRPGEQEMLLRALLGDTDEELSRSLHVSPATIHKRWQAVYERAAAVAPDLLPVPTVAAGERHRGAEKRRPLLTFLRSHLEELRPYRPDSPA